MEGHSLCTPLVQSSGDNWNGTAIGMRTLQFCALRVLRNESPGVVAKLSRFTARALCQCMKSRQPEL